MATQILLLEDVEKLGRKGDVVKVRPGYARNYLIPKKNGIVATKQTLHMQAKLQEDRKQKAIVDRRESEELAKRLEGVVLTTNVKVDHEGHMYGSVSALDIIDLLKEQANIECEKRFVQLKQPIKATGEHTITLRLNEGVTSSVTLKVNPEEQTK